MTVDPIMCRLLLLQEDDVILLDGVLDHVGRSQRLLVIFLGICLETANLRCMGPPLHLSIVHLQDEC